MIQPVTSGSPIVGYTQRWTTLDPNVYDVAGNLLHASVPALDLAAAFMDSDTIESNGSLSADRSVEISSIVPKTTPFSGVVVPPIISSTNPVYMRTASAGKPNGSHEFEMRVTDINMLKTNVALGCLGTDSLGRQRTISLTGQTFYRMQSPYAFIFGDSGAPVFDANQNLIGMVNGSAADPYAYLGFGTSATLMQDALKFDTWYGTQSVNDQSIATFRPGAGVWYIDNGNGKWDGNCDATGGPFIDQCFQYGMGGNVDLPVTGDWNGDSIVTIGNYRTNTDPQKFRLRNSNSAGPADIVVLTGSPSFGYKPVTGKWNGVTPYTKVGVFNPGTAPGTRRGFYLDNGDNIVNGCPGPDHCFYTDTITLAEDIPIAGDWNADGVHSVGVFRPSTSTFYLSNQDPAAIPDNGQLTAWDAVYPAGISQFGYLPVVGRWTGPNGQTPTKLGVFRPSTTGWYLDNGNYSFPGCAEDQCPSAFGANGDLPVALDKTIVKAN